MSRLDYRQGIITVENLKRDVAYLLSHVACSDGARALSLRELVRQYDYCKERVELLESQDWIVDLNTRQALSEIATALRYLARWGFLPWQRFFNPAFVDLYCYTEGGNNNKENEAPHSLGRRWSPQDVQRLTAEQAPLVQRLNQRDEDGQTVSDLSVAYDYGGGVGGGTGGEAAGNGTASTTESAGSSSWLLPYGSPTGQEQATEDSPRSPEPVNANQGGGLGGETVGTWNTEMGVGPIRVEMEDTALAMDAKWMARPSVHYR